MRRPLLAPFTPLYAAGLALRDLAFEQSWKPVRRLKSPVISIGNLSTGGAGKTPLAIALATALTARGIAVDVLSRGYGRQNSSPVRLNPEGTAAEFGDEPLLIAREAGVSVYVAAERYEAGLLAEADRSGRRDSHQNQIPAMHILDDGFQHRQLARAIDILILNQEDWRDCLLPAGNLREPLRAARRASVIAIPSNESDLEAALRAWGWQGPIWRLNRRMQVPAIDGPVAAFCGIARPEQFFAGLESAGLRLGVRTAFADHHRYTLREVEQLVAAARAARASALVTTEKDQVRLGSLLSALSDNPPLKPVPLRVEIEEETAAIAWLTQRLAVSPFA